MCQAGGQRSQPGQLLPLADEELQRAQPLQHGAHQRQGGIGAGVQQGQQTLPRDAQHLDLGDGTTHACRSVPCSAAISPWMAPGPTRASGCSVAPGALGDLQLAS